MCRHHGWARQEVEAVPAAAQGSISGEFGSPCGTLGMGRRLAAHVTLLAVRGSRGRHNGVLNDRRPHNLWRPQLLVQRGETVALRSIAPPSDLVPQDANSPDSGTTYDSRLHAAS